MTDATDTVSATEQETLWLTFFYHTKLSSHRGIEFDRKTSSLHRHGEDCHQLLLSTSPGLSCQCERFHWKLLSCYFHSRPIYNFARLISPFFKIDPKIILMSICKRTKKKEASTLPNPVDAAGWLLGSLKHGQVVLAYWIYLWWIQIHTHLNHCAVGYRYQIVKKATTQKKRLMIKILTQSVSLEHSELKL